MKKYTVFAAFSGATSVALGAFGAHGLKEVLTSAMLNSFLTGIRYQVIHSLLILIIVSLPVLSISNKKTISLLLSIGIVLFSGSIYLLTLGLVPSAYVWFVTPVGGLLLLAAWLLLAISLLKQKNDTF
ncbi:DUF423 domain-containing protein [Wenyingzhuangia sp. IMCC45533]